METSLEGTHDLDLENRGGEELTYFGPLLWLRHCAKHCLYNSNLILRTALQGMVLGKNAQSNTPGSSTQK